MSAQLAFGVGVMAGFILSVIVAWVMEARGVYPDDLHDVENDDP